MKIKHFIRIKGPANCGKTATVNWTFLKILKQKSSNLIKIKATEGEDFIALIDFKNVLLAFISRGDSKECCEEDFDELSKFVKKDIDIIIFSTRSRGGTVEFWNEKLQKNNKNAFDYILKNSHCEEEIFAYIKQQSQTLFNEIKKLTHF
ncbi:hypothetical protein H2279_00760 [Campylobacter sp. B0100352/1]|uniref:hypothetical protein n=1 Tax=Campylobacter sp. B0100352/1 TaxID=2735783 RepID=UPI001D8F939B|nr:hypothetical protein [Campylobacter sp. B0100352/1]